MHLALHAMFKWLNGYCRLAHQNDLPSIECYPLYSCTLTLDNIYTYALNNTTTEDQTEIVERLLKCGANPNLIRADGGTPLMDAAWGGNVVILELLLKHGADPLRKSGETALDQARACNHQAAVTILELLENK